MSTSRPARTATPPTSEPIYIHDCQDCVYLGDTEDSSGVPFDLYVCQLEFPGYPSSDPCYLARYGDSPEDYYSYTHNRFYDSSKVEALATARTLHQERLAQSMNRHPASQTLSTTQK